MLGPGSILRWLALTPLWIVGLLMCRRGKGKAVVDQVLILRGSIYTQVGPQADHEVSTYGYILQHPP